MREPSQEQLRVSDDVHIEDFDDELVALHLITEEIYVLNGSAAVFLRSIQAHSTPTDALAEAAARFGKNSSDIEADFTSVVSDLVERNLLVS